MTNVRGYLEHRVGIDPPVTLRKLRDAVRELEGDGVGEPIPIDALVGVEHQGFLGSTVVARWELDTCGADDCDAESVRAIDPDGMHFCADHDWSDVSEGGE